MHCKPYEPMDCATTEVEAQVSDDEVPTSDDRFGRGRRALLACVAAAGLVACASLAARPRGATAKGQSAGGRFISTAGAHHKHLHKRHRRDEEVDWSEWRAVWVKQGASCLVVPGGEDENGNVAQLSKCSAKDTDMQFLVRKDAETSAIKWVAHPDKCLDAPEGEVMWWQCSEDMESEQTFMLPAKGKGVIKMADEHDRCIMAPADDGFLELGPCDSELAQFVIEEATMMCRYSSWSDWSACSDLCGGGISSRYRSVVQESANGDDCSSGRFETRRCNSQRCPPRKQA